MKHRSVGTRFVWVLFALALPACSFNPSGTDNLDAYLPWRDEVPFVQASSRTIEQIFFTPGEISVHHGETCTEGSKTPKVGEQLFVQREFDRGTVLLNGYRLKYRDEQSWVRAMATGIGSITMQPGLLSWEAGGILADGGFDDNIEWCYTFTAVVWSSAALQAVADDDDPMHVFKDRPYNGGSALAPVPAFLRNPAFVGSREVAVLPRGFLAMFDHESKKLLQIAYHQDAGERFVEAKKTFGNGETPQPGGPSVAAGEIVSWESTGLIKDDGSGHDQTIAELVTALAGADVGVINPPFTVVPQASCGFFCGGPYSNGVESQEREVEGVPFQYAIPSLASWELAYGINEEAVREIGVWIPRWKWSPAPTGGSLSYTLSSILDNDDHWPFFITRAQIKILGFRRQPEL